MSSEAAEGTAQPSSPGQLSMSTIRAHHRVITPNDGWAPLDLRSIWRYRELMYFFTWRDVKVRYKQTVLGFAWAVVQPLVTMLIFTVIFGHLAHLPSEGLPYPLFVFVGIVPWMYFQYVLTHTSGTVVAQSSVIGKVYFPRLVLPLSSVFSGLVDFGASLVVLIVMFFIFRAHLHAQIIFLPVFLVLAILTALSAGIWFSALNVAYRDMRYVLPLITQVWMYASPVAYSARLLRGKLGFLLPFNPMATVIDGFRWTILGVGHPPGLSSLPAVGVILVLLISGLYYFRRQEQTFADIV